MSFQAPLWLLALALIPVAWLLYLAAQRRRSRYAVRFTNLDLLANVVQKSPGWRRHLPPLLYLLGLTALVIALARPEITIEEPKETASVVLVTDSSGSMQATDVSPSRLVAAKKAGNDFIDKVPKNFRIGVVAFSESAQVLAPVSTDRGLAHNAVDSLTANGGTAMGDGLDAALKSLRPSGRRAPGRSVATILLLSDGQSTSGTRGPITVARRAKQLGVSINTVALGTDSGTLDVTDQYGSTQTIQVPPDRPTLKRVARMTGGKYFDAPSAGDLASIYEDLGSQLGYEKVQREITWVFAGGALLLVLMGGALALVWFNRFP